MSEDRRAAAAVGAVFVCEGKAARRLLRDAEFVAAWRQLHRDTEGASAFQSPEFVATWYQHYEEQFTPWLVTQSAADGKLGGLLTLAYGRASGPLVVAGAHQAEYQTPLARADTAGQFLAQAWGAIRERIPAATLSFKYAPPALVQMASGLPALRGAIEVIARLKPLMQLHPERIEGSLRKKSNKSKLNRLARLGEVQLERLHSVTALEACFDDIIAHYDLRQGASHGGCPFRADAHKRAFHLALAQHPELLHVTVLRVGTQLAAAHIGTITGDTVHLGIIAYSPMYAEHSVGKLQLLLLARRLTEEGFKKFDLTPGDDAWKERFADSHDKAYELHLYPSALARARVTVPRRFIRMAKRVARAFGIAPDHVRRWRERWGARNDARATAPATARWTRNTATITAEPASAIDCDALKDLLLDPIQPGAWERERFLAQALTRLERGEHVFTEARGGKLRYCAWSRRAEGVSAEPAMVLYDVQGFDADAFDALFEQNLAMLALSTSVEIPADASSLADVLRRLGFERTANAGVSRNDRGT